jgi:cephalosporin-C deacetylase
MPLVDKPLSELKTYSGVNPCPADFDQYWETALAEMQSTDPQAEITPADFQAPFARCSDLYFTGVGNSRVYAKLLEPKTAASKPGPALLCFHGYSGSSSDWTGYLHYVAAGFTVAFMDCRGQGGRSEDRGSISGNTLKGHIIRGLADAPDKLYYRNVYLDTAMLARIVMDLPGVDPQRLGAIGGSQGGGLTLACAALVPQVKRAAPRCPFLCDYQRVWEMDIGGSAYQEMTDFFRRFDPQHKRQEEIFTTLGYIDNQHLASRIKAQVLMFTGLMDTVCPPSTQFAAYNRISSKKSMLVFPDYAHEGYPGADDAAFAFMMELVDA